MALEPGGYAARVGLRYEIRWAARQLVRVLAEELQSIQVEPVGLEEDGVDLWLNHRDGGREAQQCKFTNRGESRWTMADLGNRGVLEKAVGHLRRDPKATFMFVSGVPAVQLEVLSRSARDSASATSFYVDQIKGTPRERDFASFCRAVDLDPGKESELSEAHALLRRIEVHTQPDSSIARKELATQVRYWVDGDPLAILSCLESLVQERLRRPIHADEIFAFLSEHGFSLRDLAKDPRVRPAVERLQKRFADSFQGQLVAGELIPRPETTEIEQAIRSRTTGLIVVHGEKGSGKSGVLFELTGRLEEKEVPFIPLRLDRMRPAGGPRSFGKSLDLPESPTVCLQSIAGPRQAVLILDQLDAVRWSAAHSEEAWDVCQALIEEAELLPDLTVVLSCRTFDLDEDHRIKGWLGARTNVERFGVGELSMTAVEQVVERAGLKNSQLTPDQTTLLRNVYQLRLWTDVGRSAGGPTNADTETSLMSAYWRQLFQELGKSSVPTSDVHALLDRLVDYMDNNSQLTAPRHLLDTHGLVGDHLLSLGVLQVSDSQVSFFHQGAFENLLARRILGQVGQKGLLAWFEDERRQSLFRRENARLVLDYLQVEEPDAYLRSVQQLIESKHIRFHLKHLSLYSLAASRNPASQEADLVLRLLQMERWRDHVLDAVQWKPHWFRVFDERGVIHEWLDSDTDEELSRALAMLSAASEEDGDRVEAILRPLEARGEEWARRCFNVLPRRMEKDSPALSAMRLRLLRRGFEWKYPDWGALAQCSFPRFVELLKATVERRQSEIGDASLDQRVGIRGEMRWDGLEKVELAQVGLDQLSSAWSELTGAFDALVEAARTDYDAGDTLVGYGLTARSLEGLVAFIADVGAEIAERDWEELRSLLAAAEPLRLGTTALVMEAVARVGSAEPGLGDWFINWLIEEPSRLRLRRNRDERTGELVVGAVQCASRLCSDTSFLRLEAFLVRFREPDLLQSYSNRHRALFETSVRKGNLRWPSNSGRTAWMLLPALSGERLSPRGTRTLLELERKFGQERTPKVEEGGWVGSPLADQTPFKLSGYNWLGVIRNNSTTRDRRSLRQIDPGRVAESSPTAFANDLRRAAEQEPERFARLLARFPREAHPIYIERLIDGLARNAPPEGSSGEQSRDWRPATHESLRSVICDSAVRNNPDVLESIVRLLTEHAAVDWPVDVLREVIDRAAGHADPLPGRLELTSNRDEDWSPWSLETNSLNCTRGKAAYAIRALLFKHHDFLPFLQAPLETLVRDPHPAVRVAAAGACVPILNFDRDLAVRLFLRACGEFPGGPLVRAWRPLYCYLREVVNGVLSRSSRRRTLPRAEVVCNDRILGTRMVGQFIRYALNTHMRQLAPVLGRMVKSSCTDVAKIGAELTAGSYIVLGRLGRRLSRLLRGTIPQRSGLAATAAQLLQKSEHHDAAKALLTKLLDDPAPEVSQAVADSFRCCDLGLFADQDAFLVAYARSRAFETAPSSLLYALSEHSGSVLSFSDCILRAADTFAESLASKSRDLASGVAADARTMPALLLRLYAESSKAGYEAINRRCLDVWDSLLESRVGSAQDFTAALDAA